MILKYTYGRVKVIIYDLIKRCELFKLYLSTIIVVIIGKHI